MSKSLLWVLIVGVAGYFAWNHFSKPEVLTPDQEIERFLQKKSYSAMELTDFADRFPMQIAKSFRDRRITVTGVLQKAFVKGVGSYDLILDLQGSKKRKITFTSDVNSYARMNNRLDESKKKYQKIGREIVVYESAKSTGSGKSGSGALQKMIDQIIPTAFAGETMPEATEPPDEKNKSNVLVERVVFRELDSVTLEGIFQYMSNSAIFIEWKPPNGK